MSIGGVDVLLLAPAAQAVGDVILRACRRHWEGHECFFQDAEETAVHSLDEPWVWAKGADSQEFFVYRDGGAVRSWEEDGATRANANTMLHFIMGERPPGGRGVVEIALVCDRITPDIRRLAEDLQSNFSSLGAGGGEKEAA